MGQYRENIVSFFKIPSGGAEGTSPPPHSWICTPVGEVDKFEWGRNEFGKTLPTCTMEEMVDVGSFHFAIFQVFCLKETDLGKTKDQKLV